MKKLGVLKLLMPLSVILGMFFTSCTKDGDDNESDPVETPDTGNHSGVQGDMAPSNISGKVLTLQKLGLMITFNSASSCTVNSTISLPASYKITSSSYSWKKDTSKSGTLVIKYTDYYSAGAGSKITGSMTMNLILSFTSKSSGIYSGRGIKNSTTAIFGNVQQSSKSYNYTNSPFSLY